MLPRSLKLLFLGIPHTTWTPPPFVTCGTVQLCLISSFMFRLVLQLHEASSYHRSQLMISSWAHHIISSAPPSSAAPCSAVPWLALACAAVLCGVVQCSAVRCSTVPCCAVLSALLYLLFCAYSIIIPGPSLAQLGSSAQLSSAQLSSAQLSSAQLSSAQLSSAQLSSAQQR